MKGLLDAEGRKVGGGIRVHAFKSMYEKLPLTWRDSMHPPTNTHRHSWDSLNEFSHHL